MSDSHNRLQWKRREFLSLAATAAAAAQSTPAPLAVPPLGESLPLRFRQVHLDFHTSEHIAGIGDQFDPERFAALLERARVNSITCFARCHHGLIYYDTKKFPERKHPHLKRHLLKEQIEACHKHNIRVPIYLTVQWDYFTSLRHPEWLVLDEKGAPTGTPVFEPGFYRYLCVNTPYREFLDAHVREIFDTVPVDGLFFDIVQPCDCACFHCRTAMEKAGLNPSDGDARRAFGLRTINEFHRSMTAYVRKFDKNCSIFYNAGHIGPRHREVAQAYTHWELESLPSGGWGYLDFPLKQRYVRTLGMEALGMTGKFHTSWGDFHSLKNRAALEYECFLMLALGAKCSVGDQLHPSGKLDEATYDLIGGVFRQVEQKEPWCAGASGVPEIGVFTPEEFLGGAARQIPAAAFGAVRMLQELRYQFDVLDSKSDLAPYRLLILPDQVPVSTGLAARIEKFLAGGGALIASYESGLDDAKKRFTLRALGVELAGDAPYSPDFIVPRGRIGEGLPATELVMYLKGKQVRAAAGAEVLAEVNVPYFNRTWEHFSSHRHTPSAGKPGYPGAVRNGRAIYFMHPLFEQYQANAPRWVKQLVANAIGMLMPDPLVAVEAPSTVFAALSEQPKQNRRVLHLLHYIPERRGQAFDVIEDVIPIYDLKVSVKAGRTVREVLAVPGDRKLAFEARGGRVHFTLPKLEGHQMIALELA